ncbi:MAG: YbjN domain-containing protein [Oscillospiraceae bacterium]|nr:YbjN domain-containing protein [Oscillospiraceae bacterium]
MNDEQMKMAKNVYDTICRMFDSLEYHYDCHEEELAVHCTVQGDDLPMDIVLIVHAERELVTLLSPMPFPVPEERRMDMALAVNIANYGMVDGSFDFDLSSGEIRFRMTTSYIESILSEPLFQYMLACAAQTVDEYNDRFFMITKGMLSLEQFVEMEADIDDDEQQEN